MTIGILGGGLTGLTLGYLLNKKSESVEILEAGKQCGGLMRSLVEDGYTFDIGGSHIVFTKDREVMDFMLSLLGSNIQKNRRNTKVLYKGTFVKYPFENGLGDLPKQENYECLLGFVQNLLSKERAASGGKVKDPANLEEWCHSKFGKGIAEKYLIPYNEKIWKHPPSDTSLEWVGRIPDPPVEDILKSSVGIETEGYTHQLHFFYPLLGGIEALLKPLLAEPGNRVVTGAEVVGVAREKGAWVVRTADGKVRTYSRLISTIPVTDLVHLASAPGKVKEAAGNLKFNSLVCIMLGIDKGAMNDLSWLYIPDRDVTTHRVSFPFNFSARAAPEGKSSLLAEVTCKFGDGLWKMDDASMVERTVSDLSRLKLFDREKVVFSRVARVKHAYVINDLDYRRNLKIVEDHFASEGISLVGRFSAFQYLNMDGCIRAAMDFVNAN